MTEQEMIDALKEYKGTRIMHKMGGYWNGTWTKATIGIMESSDKAEGVYEAHVVYSDGGRVTTWGNSTRSLWARVRKETLRRLAVSR